MTDLPKELHKTNHPKIGEVKLTKGVKHVTYLRTLVQDGDIHSSIQRGDNIDKEISLDLTDARKILDTEYPIELPNVEPVENVPQNYNCNFCGEEDESVLRYKAVDGMFPMSFHYDCLCMFAKASLDLLENNTNKLVAGQL